MIRILLFWCFGVFNFSAGFWGIFFSVFRWGFRWEFVFVTVGLGGAFGERYWNDREIGPLLPGGGATPRCFVSQ